MIERHFESVRKNIAELDWLINRTSIEFSEALHRIEEIVVGKLDES